MGRLRGARHKLIQKSQNQEADDEHISLGRDKEKSLTQDILRPVQRMYSDWDD